MFLTAKRFFLTGSISIFRSTGVVEKRRSFFLNKNYFDFAVLFHKKVEKFNNFYKVKAIVAEVGKKKGAQ